MHTHTHTHSHTRSRAHAHTHTHTHKYKHTHTSRHIHTHLYDGHIKSKVSKAMGIKGAVRVAFGNNDMFVVHVPSSFMDLATTLSLGFAVVSDGASD